MNKKVKTIMGFILLVVVIAGATFAYRLLSDNYVSDELNSISNEFKKNESQESGADKNKAAVDFTVIDVDGNDIKLSDFIGKPIVLNFWASWCPPCIAELPDFEKVYQEVKDEVTFLMVDLVSGQRETVTKGSQFIKDNGFNFPVYFDTLQEAANAYKILSIPRTLFIDSNGNIVTQHEGQINEKMLREGISLIYAE